MAKTTNTPEPRSAVGVRAMNWASNAAVIVNPQATPEDLFSWVVAELESLQTWMNILACSKCEIELPPAQIAVLVGDRIAPVVQGLLQALESGKF